VAPALPASAAASPAERVAAKPAPKPAPAEVIEAPKKVAMAPAKAPATDGTRAKALLEGAQPAKPDGTRFVVQVGAFADAAAARETRLKVEKLGLKTYTQVAETAAGNRIRVRAGPFATRDEAESALAKTKAAGMNAVVLTL
jgi:DedD protein